MDQKMAGRKSVLPVPNEDRDQEESNDQKHCWKSRSSKVLTARRVPCAKPDKREQFNCPGVFRQHAQADQGTSEDPPSQAGLILRMPESQRCRGPEENINGVDRH